MIKQKVPTVKKYHHFRLSHLNPSFLGAISWRTRDKLQKVLQRFRNCCKLGVNVKFQNKLPSAFRFKNQISKELTSGIV